MMQYTAKEKTIHTTPEKNINVRINKKYAADGTCRLSGVAFDTQTGQQIGGRLKRKARDAEDAVYKEKQLCNALISRLHRKNSSQTKKTKKDRSSTSQIAIVLERFKSSGRGVDGWSDTTLHAVITAFEHQLLPVLQAYEDVGEVDDSVIENFKEMRSQEVLQHGRSRGVPEVAARSVSKSLSSQLRLYQELIDYNEIFGQSEMRLPIVTYFMKRIRGKPDLEQAKSLPEAVRQKMIRRLEELVSIEPKEVFATVIMFDVGLRTGEAAAVYPGDIQYRTIDQYTFATLAVLWQDKDDFRSPILKTRSSYRIVPLSRWACGMLEKCQRYFGEFDWSSGRVLVPNRRLSAWIAKLLKECGCDDVFMSQAQKLQSLFPNTDIDGSVVFDIAAYLLRHDAASRMRNICGFSQFEIDRMLGHEPSVRAATNSRPTFKTAEELFPLAQKLERYQYDPAAGYAPVCLTADGSQQLIPFQENLIHTEGTEPSMVTIDIEAEEPGESIVITVSNPAQRITYRSVKKPPSRDRTVIGGNGR